MKRIVATAAIAVLMTGAAWAQVEGENLIGNPGFEDALEGWDEREKPIVLDEEVRFTGRYACKSVGHAELQYPGFHWVKSADIPAEPNTMYQFSLMLKASFTEGIILPSVREVGADGKTIRYHRVAQIEPGVHEWRALSRPFNSALKAHHFQVYLVMRDVIGTAWYDDLKLVKITPEPRPPVGTGEAVSFPGSAGSLDMRVESVSQLKTMPPITIVQTTGALVRINEAAGTITGFQRIGNERPSYTIKIDPPPAGLAVMRSDESVCILGNADIEIGIQCDSLVALAVGRETKFTVTGAFGGKWTQNQQGHVQVIDDDGGVGVYPYVVPGSGIVSSAEQEPGDLSQGGWECSHEMGEGTLLGVSIFPPRAYDWEKSFNWQLAHTNHFPPESALARWSKYVKLVTLHQGIWAGDRRQEPVGPYMIEDESEFRRVIATCHRLGLKLIPYMSPFYFHDQSVDGFMESLSERKEEYGFDGTYFDGLYFKDWVKSYEVMRRTREMFPDGPLYLHTSWGPPVGQHDIWCPFIDTYADIVLRGEGRKSDTPGDMYMRYVAAGYKLSNTIGLMKGADWEISAAEQYSIMLDYNGRARMSTYPSHGADGEWVWPGQDGELTNAWIDSYWPRLQAMRAEWEAGRLP